MRLILRILLDFRFDENALNIIKGSHFFNSKSISLDCCFIKSKSRSFG